MANINPPVTTQLGHADPNASPLTVNELIDLFNTLFHSEIQGDYIPYVIGADTPAVDDNHKAWIKLDTGGRPIAIMTFYNGNWRRVYNGMPGEIRGYSGNPGFNTSGDFDVNGRGNIGGNYDGWQICNGKNASPDLSNKFLLGANMDNAVGTPAGYDNGWQAVIDGAPFKTGGVFKYTLSQSQIPQTPKAADGELYRWSATGNVQDNGGPLWGLNNPNATPHPLIPADPGNPNPGPIPLSPPFYALAWIIFQGYA
jgi:hypothetical protein